MNFTTQCRENRHTDITNFAALIHTKKLIHCVTIFTILYGNYYPPHGVFKLICIGKFAKRTWVNSTQQYGKNRQRCQQSKFYYAVWQLLLYYYREFPSKILSVYKIRSFSPFSAKFLKENYPHFSTIMKNYSAHNLDLAELGAKIPFFRKFKIL